MQQAFHVLPYSMLTLILNRLWFEAFEWLDRFMKNNLQLHECNDSST